MIDAYEHALKPKPGDIQEGADYSNMTPAQIKFAKRMANKNGENTQPTIPGFGAPGGQDQQ